MTGNEYQHLASRTISKDITRVDQEYHALHGMVGCPALHIMKDITKPQANIGRKRSGIYSGLSQSIAQRADGA